MADESGPDATGRVLLVAADAEFTAELQRQLQRHELKTRVRQTGDQALAALAEEDEQIDLVVLDSSLAAPELFRVYERLRSADAATFVPILYSRSTFAVAEGSAGGPDAYLGPTATPRQVADRARALLPGRPERAEPGPDQGTVSAAGDGGPGGAAEQSRSGTRTAILGVLLGILIGIAVLAMIWMGGLPVTLPLLTPVMGG
jgi:DNA-binding response OmpR family regulator